MKRQKLLALLLAMALAVTSFAGCSAPESEKKDDSSSETSSQTSSKEEEIDTTNVDGDLQLNEPGVLPLIEGEAPTFTAFAAPQYEVNSKLDAASNSASAYYEDLTNVHVEYTLSSQADKTAKLSLLFTTDDYPDIIFGTYWNGATLYSYGTQGLILPLTEYYENDAYFWDKYVQAAKDADIQTETYLNDLIMPDGNIYSLYSGLGNPDHVSYSKRLWIYEPWLDTLKLDIPTTTDEYYEVLKAFKTQDPNGNGESDEIPLTGSKKSWNTDPFEFLMNSFLYYQDTDRMFVKDGKITMAYTQDEYKDGLLYMRKLMDEGLLHADTYTQDANALKNLTCGDVQVVGSVPGGFQSSFTLVTDGEEGDWTNWTTVAPFEGPNGVQNVRYISKVGTASAQITDNCKYPKLAFRFCDVQYDQTAGYNISLGEEGEYWRWAEDGELDALGNQADMLILKTASLATDDTNFAWNSTAIANDNYPGAGRAVLGDLSLSREASLFESWDLYKNYTPDLSTIVPQLVFSEDESKDIVDYTLTLNERVNTNFTNFLYNKSVDELDAEWDALQKDLISMGVEDYVAIYQKAYDSKMALK